MRLLCVLAAARWQLAVDAVSFPGVVRWLGPAALAAGALALVAWHWSSWRTAQAADLPAAELDYRRKQFRRRTQASGMLAIAAAALIVGQFIPWRERPSLYVWFWCGTALLLVWVVALAVGDLLATRVHFRHLFRERSEARAALHAELSRLRGAQDGGETAGAAPPPGDA